MIRKKLVHLQELGMDTSIPLEEISSIPSSLFPVLTMKSEIRLPDKSLRAKLILKQVINHGTYGDIRLAVRSEGESEKKTVVVKGARMEGMDLTQEAILQHAAYTCMIANRIPWAIPAVYDIFLYGGKTMFSMDRIQGVFLDAWFQKSKEPDRDFLLIMGQLCIYLCILHQCLGLDHRDLKADNLLISEQPCQLQFQYKNKKYTLISPFRLHILDFGFACLGEGGGQSAFVTLGDVLPVLDPCPKEGRDLFQFLLSVLSVKTIRTVLSHSVLVFVEAWVGKKFADMAARMIEDTTWIYLLTSSAEFHCPNSTPYHVLRDIFLFSPSLFLADTSA